VSWLVVRVAPVQLVAGVRCGPAAVRPRFRREVRRFTSDLERGPDGAQGARTGAGGRAPGSNPHS
jgi:hypothetical protein